jgi:hypothetical protein
MFAGRQVSPLRRLSATAALWLCAGLASAQNAAPRVRSIDLYRSAALDSPSLLAEIESDIARYAAIRAEGTNSDANRARLEAEEASIEARVEAKLAARVPLAFFEIDPTFDFGPPLQIDVTIDVVEQADAARRMPFREAPTGAFEDPDGLLAVWDEYLQKMFRLAMSGAPTSVRASDCPTLHCLAPFELPELAPYLPRFNEGARKHEETLYRIAEQSADASLRANALFLLAHTNDAERLLPVLTRAIYDPASDVRNNAMRVLFAMRQKGIDVEYPVRDLIGDRDYDAWERWARSLQKR